MPSFVIAKAGATHDKCDNCAATRWLQIQASGDEPTSSGFGVIDILPKCRSTVVVLRYLRCYGSTLA